MRKQVFTIAAALTCFVLVFVAACIKDKCGNTVCLNNGLCVEAKCVCVSGYEGAHCEEQWNTKYDGVWHATDTYIRDTTGFARKYDLVIAGTQDSFMLTGLADTLGAIVCKRDSRFSFTMQPRVIDSFVALQNGTAVMDTGKQTITGTYTLRIKGNRGAGTISGGPHVIAKYFFRDIGPKFDTAITIRSNWKR